jgi:hypothetical protein
MSPAQVGLNMGWEGVLQHTAAFRGSSNKEERLLELTILLWFCNSLILFFYSLLRTKE